MLNMLKFRSKELMKAEMLKPFYNKAFMTYEKLSA
jgi:hypothetical protein